MYESVTYEKILERMLNRVSPALDRRKGSVIWDTHSPTAIELQILYIELDTILREAYGDTASREYLIKRAKERGIEPTPSTQAVLKGEFEPASVDVLNKRFNLHDLNYVVTEKIADGVYSLTCEMDGSVGNRYLGSLIPMEYIDGLETAKITEVLIPGEDEEDTESLRVRYFASFEETAFGGNRADYISKVNGIKGVGATKVTRVWNSNLSPAKMIPSPEVQSWYSATIKSVSDDVAKWLKEIYTATCEKKLTVGGTVKITIMNSEFNVPSEELLKTVQEAIDPEQCAGEGYGLAPIGHIVTIKPVDAVLVKIRSSISFGNGYSWSNLQESIETVISDYLLELRKEWAENDFLIVRLSQIESRIMGIKGVLDIADTQINENSSNLTLKAFEIPVFGGVESA